MNKLMNGSVVVAESPDPIVWDEQQQAYLVGSAYYVGQHFTVVNVPISVSIRQACRALEQVGKLDELEAAIAQAPRWVQIDWAKCTEVRRDWPAIPLMQPALGMTDAEIDALFVLAGSL